MTDKQKKVIFIRIPILILVFITGIFLLFNIFHVIQEQIILNHITRNLLSTNHIGDYVKLKRVMNFVNKNVTVNKGKYGYLRASPVEIMNETIGGQCGEFSRLTIVLLKRMDIPAHRVYLFKDDKKNVSNHVMIRVKIKDRWILVDPLYNFIFYDENQEKYYDIITQKKELYLNFINKYPGVSHRRCAAPDTFIYIYPITYENLNNYSYIFWKRFPLSGMITGVAGLFLPNRIHEIPLPYLMERPYLLKMILNIILFFILVLIYFEVLSRQKKKF